MQSLNMHLGPRQPRFAPGPTVPCQIRSSQRYPPTRWWGSPAFGTSRSCQGRCTRARHTRSTRRKGRPGCQQACVAQFGGGGLIRRSNGQDILGSKSKVSHANPSPINNKKKLCGRLKALHGVILASGLQVDHAVIKRGSCDQPRHDRQRASRHRSGDGSHPAALRGGRQGVRGRTRKAGQRLTWATQRAGELVLCHCLYPSPLPTLQAYAPKLLGLCAG
jgi:hypothetical protein